MEREIRLDLLDIANEMGKMEAVTIVKKHKVFLAWATPEIEQYRTNLAYMLEKAGFEVFPKIPQPSVEPEFVEAVAKALEQTECSIHLLGAEFGRTIKGDPYTSLSKYQLENAGIMSKRTQGKFKRFVWNYPHQIPLVEDQQQDFINAIQNDIANDVVFTNVNSSAQFVEEIRYFLENAKADEVIEKKEYDVSFIFNVQDAADCYNTVEKLSEGLKVSTLTVVPELNKDYRIEAIQQIRKSNLCIVYFKESSDWAVAFIKQVWKMVGGASAATPMLLIGEDEPRRNRFLHFKAPQVLLAVVPREQIFPKIQEVIQMLKSKGKIEEDTYSPYPGLRPFNENESIYFKGRDKHVETVIHMLETQKYVMVTGASGDGKSSLIYAGVIPNAKAGFVQATFSKWLVADFKPERSPLHNLSIALANVLKVKNVEEVESQLSYGFSALIDIYKKSDAYCDMTSQEWADADEETRRTMKRRAANLLILVDQFEEFFTNVENYRDGTASPVSQITINVILETIRIAREEQLPIYVVFTMRSDYIGQCVAFRGFAEMIGNSTYFVPRLKREEIQEVIQTPAILNGDRISLRLTQRILNDLGDGSDQLPVLQHALQQMWTTAKDEEIDLIHYAMVGGLPVSKLPKSEVERFTNWFHVLPEERKVLYEKPRLRNVLSRHANELFDTVANYYNSHHSEKITTEEAQLIVRTTFVCLTKIDDNRAVRNRMRLHDITQIIGKPEIHDEKVYKVLNLFREQGNTFIQPFITEDEYTRELNPDTSLDITHESLIRNWELLVDWADAEHKSVGIYKDFRVQIEQWLDNNRADTYLLTSGLYNYFNGWFESAQPNAAWICRYWNPGELSPVIDPMEKSQIYLEDMEEFLYLSKQKIDRNKRLVLFAISLISTLLVISMIAAWMAFQSKGEADTQKELAIEQKVIAEKQKIIAENKEREAQIQRMLVETEKLRAENQTIIAEHQTKVARGEKIKAEEQRKIAQNNERIAKLQEKIAHEQRAIAESKTKEAQRERDRAEQEADNARRSETEAKKQTELAKVQRNNALVTQSLFLSSLAEKEVANGRGDVGLLLAMEALPKDLNDPDRPYVEEAEASLYYSLNSMVNKDAQVTLIGHKNKMIFNMFSPDGKRIVTTSWDKTARLWDAETGRQLGVLQGHNHIVENAKFSDDGNNLITLSEDFTARLWDFQKFKLNTVFRGHANLLTSADITKDAKKVVTTSIDNTARLWDAKTGDVIAVLKGHTNHVLFATFSPDGKHVVTCSKDSSARLWDTETGDLIARLYGHTNVVKHAAFSPDGHTLATASADGNIILWNGNTGSMIKTLKGHFMGVNYVTFNHSGNVLASCAADSTVRVWDTKSGEEKAVMKGHMDNVYKVTFSPDDKRIVSSSDDKTVRLWDATSYLRLAIYDKHPGLLYSASFSPDSKRIAMAAPSPKFAVNVYKVFPNLQELIDYANSYKKRDLTDEEKKKYFIKDFRVRKEVLDEINNSENIKNNPNKILTPETR